MKVPFRYLSIIILCLSLVLTSCGGGGGVSIGVELSNGINSPTPVAASIDLLVTKFSDPHSAAIGVAADTDWKERLAYFGTKDALGVPISLTRLNYSTLGQEIIVELSSDGLPAVISDQIGNKFILTNFTSYSAELTYYSHEGSILFGPVTIAIDAKSWH